MAPTTIDAKISSWIARGNLPQIFRSFCSGGFCPPLGMSVIDKNPSPDLGAKSNTTTTDPVNPW
jgi:hypothetical protein